ncbi:MAG: hypothetical protein ABEH77_02970 [Halobacteriaceae archaeon]
MSEHGVLVVNPLPWERELGGRVPVHAVEPRGTPEDPTAGRQFADRHAAARSGERYWVGPVTVPGFGYRVVPAGDIEAAGDREFDERSTVKAGGQQVTFDRETGGVAAWRVDGREWVDRDADYPLGGFVHEEVADRGTDWARDLLFRTDDGTVERALRTDYETRGWQPDWHARRRGATRVTRHRVRETPLGVEAEQHIDAPGVEDAVLRFRPRGGELVVEAEWSMTRETHPEATYLAFPFDVADPTRRVDVGGQAVVAGRDQLGRSCHDYYTAQRWADVSGADGGVTVGTPLNPLVQFGEFSFGANRADPAPGGLLLGWVTNNYWETNFRASQPGRVRARYHLRPHGGFKEAAAHRHGLAAAHADPLVATLAEPADGALPRSGSLLDLPDPPVLVLQVRPADAPAPGDRFLDADAGGDGLCVLLKNASDDPREATVGSGLLRVDTAERTGVLGGTGEPLGVADGTAAVELDPRETAMVVLRVE